MVHSPITAANSVPGAAVLVFRDPDNIQLELFAGPPFAQDRHRVGSRAEPGLGHPDHREAELGVRTRTQAGRPAGVQIGVAIDHQQAQPAQILQDRTQRRELAQAELARPGTGGTPGRTAVRSASTCAKAASAASTAAARAPPVLR